MRRKRFLFALAVLLGAALTAGCVPEKAEEDHEAGEQQQQQVFQQSEGDPALSAVARKQRPQKDEPRRLPDKLKLRRAAAKKITPPVGLQQKNEARKAAAEQTPYPAGTAPRIGADEPVFDYGEVAQGAAVKHTFIIKNLGKNPLVIERAEAG